MRSMTTGVPTGSYPPVRIGHTRKLQRAVAVAQKDGNIRAVIVRDNHISVAVSVYVSDRCRQWYRDSVVLGVTNVG